MRKCNMYRLKMHEKRGNFTSMPMFFWDIVCADDDDDDGAWCIVLDVKQATWNKTHFLLLYLKDSKDWDLCHLEANIHTGNDTMRFFPPKRMEKTKDSMPCLGEFSYVFIYLFLQNFLCFSRKMSKNWKKKKNKQIMIIV